MSSIGDVITERKGKDMGDTVLLAIYFPIIIGGMLGVIIWGMSAAGARHTELSREGSLNQSRKSFRVHTIKGLPTSPHENGKCGMKA